MPRTVKFQIYRYDPDKDRKPYMQDLTVELKDTDKMLLDALQRIKADVDDTLSLSRSCSLTVMSPVNVQPRRHPGRRAGLADWVRGSVRWVADR